MATKKETSFKESFEALQKIVTTLESGSVDLDESIAQFEKGLELAAICKKHLAEVENKVIDIKKKYGNSLEAAQEE